MNCSPFQLTPLFQYFGVKIKKLPLLAKIVRSVCCAPPTTVSSEQDFSMGSDIVTQKRNKLSDKRVECLSFLKRNLSREFSNKS